MCARPWITLVIVQIDYNVLIIKLFVVGHLKMHREDIFGRIFMTILRNGKRIKQGSLSVCAVAGFFVLLFSWFFHIFLLLFQAMSLSIFLFNFSFHTLLKKVPTIVCHFVNVHGYLF